LAPSSSCSKLDSMDDRPRHSTAHTLRVGVVTIVTSIALMFLPLLTGAKIGRFIVVIALVGLLIGASIAINALIDQWRGGA
jgi:hypothetical protein